MESTLDEGGAVEPICDREIFYQRERTRNRLFSDLVLFFQLRAEETGINKKVIAEKLRKDPSQITRWLSQPSNLTLDTLSDLLLSLDAEMDCKFVKFSDRAIPNFAHEWAIDYGHVSAPTIHVVSPPQTSSSTVHISDVSAHTTSTRHGITVSVSEVETR